MEMIEYLEIMVEKGASDIFFSPNFPIMIKVEGSFSPINEERKLKESEVKDLAYSLMKEKDIKAFEEKWEANLGITVNNLGRFRVNVMNQRGAIAIVIRYLNISPPSIDSLRLPPAIPFLALEKRGLILVAGATGSGKSTTLAAMIDYRNKEQAGHILTIEDPIEYIYSYKKSIINQREIGTDTKSYDEGLKSALREAPDVILIGEIRDKNTMRNAINYAETGHLCLATIHGSNSIETINRVVNFFPAEEHKQLFIDLSQNLKAIICQRLILGANEKRYAVVELLKDTPYIKELIQEGKVDSIKEVMERNMEDDVITFDQAIMNLFKEKMISKDQAMLFADSKHNMDVQLRLLEGNPIKGGSFELE